MNIIRYDNILDDEIFKFIYKSPIGNIIVETNNTYILRLYFSDDINFYSKETYYPFLIKKLFLELDEYFIKKRKKFTISIGLKLTDFQYNVLLETLKIPYGKISTYSDIAKVISNKRGFINRAVAKVESQNPIAILIPCHRVVAKNMMLGGYFYGLDKKEYLLSNEGVNIFNKKIVL